jgi:hypothetical protein
MDAMEHVDAISASGCRWAVAARGKQRAWRMSFSRAGCHSPSGACGNSTRGNGCAAGGAAGELSPSVSAPRNSHVKPSAGSSLADLPDCMARSSSYIALLAHSARAGTSDGVYMCVYIYVRRSTPGLEVPGAHGVTPCANVTYIYIYIYIYVT